MGSGAVRRRVCLGCAVRSHIMHYLHYKLSSRCLLLFFTRWPLVLAGEIRIESIRPSTLSTLYEITLGDIEYFAA